MKPLTLFGSSFMIIAMLISAVAFINKKNDIPEKHLEVVLRNIGHQLLLTAKDSTSRVLPVKKLNENTYQISFQNDLGFISDTLINLVERTLQKNALADDYIVNLKKCDQMIHRDSLGETVLAFEINKQAGNLTPCRGRKLEVGCYVLEIELLKKGHFNLLWLSLLIIPLGIAGFCMKDGFRKKEDKATKEDTASAPGDNNYIALGSFQFYPANNELKGDHSTIALSDKETKALKIFTESINQVVNRETLMKEIWEDEGIVVISRNVDVLVSKLRKKLSNDSSLKFINVHGRGYKLVIE